MTAPNRRGAFRRAAIFHFLFVTAAGIALERLPTNETLTLVGYALVAAGIVEGGILVGWRLTQLPKSPALEFVLTSPLQPRRFFLAEALVGLSRFALVTLAGLPPLLLMQFSGKVESFDILPLMLVPFLWGSLAGIGIAAWTYETRLMRRIGEAIAIFGVLTYLIIGVLAAERLREWLQALPPDLGQSLFDLFQGFYNYNPFGLMKYWLDPRQDPITAVDRMWTVNLAVSAMLTLLLARGACRLRGHFGDRHYGAIESHRQDQSRFIGERPLSWWAVRRVMEYSGRINLWLAGGFAVVYSAYLIVADQWPPWMGQLVFQIFERLGGAPILATGMVILAAVPAAFQYGLWDANVPDRCRRLELLLLTDLQPADYWHAALMAAWRRGRGYLAIALMLWGALVYSGRATPGQVLASMSAGVVLWNFAFVVGFYCFSTGKQANGFGSLLTLGLPLFAFFAIKIGEPALACLFPPGAVFLALTETPGIAWAIGPSLVAGFTLWLAQHSREGCDLNLRTWYDRNHGLRMVD